ncbi:hypothetical protein ACFQDG_06470 [Natronoarchaeum mannanilyticum]|uniref:DUF1450 domain-containing protein n=1 Tax=Natronoarchaeum mannanilyticum TaxID=926360 RepID=A0AAV3TBW3_9EURY
MEPTVECCLRNVTPECRTAARRRGIELSVAPCRERCDACRAGPFVLVDGDLRTGETFGSLLDDLETASSGGEDADAASSGSAAASNGADAETPAEGEP